MAILLAVLRAVAAAYVIAVAGLFLFQNRILLPAPPRHSEIRLGDHGGYDVQPWKPKGAYAGYAVAPTLHPVHGTFVLYHGNEESAEDKLPIADVLVRHGYRVVLVEYPGHGRLAGARTMKAALQASRRALVAARTSWPGPLFVIGESLGAGMAAQSVVGNERDIAGALLLTPWDSLASVASEKLPYFPVSLLLFDRFDSVNALTRYAGPVVVVGAGQDALIPVRHAERLVHACQHARLLVLPDAGHDDWFEHMRAGQWETALRWLGAIDAQ
jgi:alpha-beta hydrolase superfamily lysophospholipase